MPAELSLYSLSFIDRILIARTLGLAEAGLYSIAVKMSQGIAVLVRGFQLAFPPLAYSIQDDDDARKAYSAVVTWFVTVMAFVVAFLWLIAPWIVALLAAPEFADAADSFLVAQAHAGSHTVVTHERISDGRKRIKIPNACIELDIRFMTPYEMLRTERARFVLPS